MGTMPKDPLPDSTAALFVEGYEFISNRCERLGSDVFRTRILLQPTICMRGRDAAELFYDTARFRRAGAAPRRLRKTLFGEGAVQSLDDEAHRHRKAMFLSLMTPARVQDLVRLVEEEWRARATTWERTGEVVLYDEVGRILTAAVHAWAGVPLDPSDLDQRLHDLHGMIVGGGGLGPNYLRGRIGRQRAEARLSAVIEAVRRGELDPPPATALHAVAWHRELDGRLLGPHEAAVELLNVLRPTVAVDRFVAFATLALHRHPGWRDRLRGADDATVEAFVHEVRRLSPFFPFAAARVRHAFTWQGHRFPAGRRVLLDLYATGRDPQVWDDPDTFRPERFGGGDDDPYALVPQGGGDHATGHRCPGEWITIEVMKAATRLLTRELDYTVPAQDLTVARGKVPALPRSGVVIADVRCVRRPRR